MHGVIIYLSLLATFIFVHSLFYLFILYHVFDLYVFHYIFICLIFFIFGLVSFHYLFIFAFTFSIS